MAQPHPVQVHSTTQTTQRYEGGHGVNTGTGYSQGGHGLNTSTGYSQYPKQHYNDGGISTLFSERGPSTSQILAVLIGVPIGGTLLFLASVSLIASLIGMAIVIPLFILFSPVLVPASLAIGLAVAGILTADACGLTGLMSLSWVMNYLREMQGMVPGQGDVYSTVKGGMADVAGYVGQKTKEVGQKTKEVGQDIQTKAHESKHESNKRST